MGLCESSSRSKIEDSSQNTSKGSILKIEDLSTAETISAISCRITGTNFEMSEKHQSIMIKHWDTIMSQKPDICHKTMLYCIEASPKLNEIIACGRYCFRDLTKWPKLDRICTAQLKFFEKLIKENNLNPDLIKSEADRLGMTHRTYAQFGLKPQFLDLFQQHFLLIVGKLKIQDKIEHQILLESWSMLLSYIISRIYLIYANRSS